MTVLANRVSTASLNKVEMEVNLKFRNAQESDYPFLLALRAESMNLHILNAGLIPTEASHLERIEYRYDCAKIVIFNSSEVGLLKVIKEGIVWDLVQIQLNSTSRGMGLGKLIVKGVLKEAFSQNASVKLSVFKGNPAKRLYESLGFRICLETETAYEMRANA